LTEPTGSSTSAIGWLARDPAATLRRSTSTVSGSGWLVRYATGSLASISTVLSAPSSRDEIDRNAGVSAPAMLVGAPAVKDTARAATIGATNTSRDMRGCIT
jgi:hypothetical protein